VIGALERWTYGGGQRSRIILSLWREAAMRTTQQLSITLPNTMADVVKAKARTGEYASENEVIRDRLRARLAAERAKA